jgi:Flp pilus assembly protein TadG
MSPPRLRDESGQAAVELVALLPLLAAILALCWQAVLTGHAAWAVSAAARAAARAAAVGGDPGAAARARLPASLERGLRVRAPGSGAVEVSLLVPPVLGGIDLGRVHATGRFRPQDPR